MAVSIKGRHIKGPPHTVWFNNEYKTAKCPDKCSKQIQYPQKEETRQYEFDKEAQHTLQLKKNPRGLGELPRDI